MKSIRLLFSAVVVSVLVTSCASGPSYAEAVKTLPPIPKGKGRVFIYRESTFGMGVRPKIKIDEQAVSTSTAQGFSYSDQSPGNHLVSLTTEWKHKDTVKVTPGQSSFVRTHVTMGAFVGHVIPTAVDKSVAESEIVNCKLVTD